MTYSKSVEHKVKHFLMEERIIVQRQNKVRGHIS